MAMAAIPTKSNKVSVQRFKSPLNNDLSSRSIRYSEHLTIPIRMTFFFCTRSQAVIKLLQSSSHEYSFDSKYPPLTCGIIKTNVNYVLVVS